ncbi:MAG: type IVB secretion system protein IcmJDotN [Gammaproteobacteria bacterium]|nr:type IVB secretion system protein IcmJDotN [Gammaproteobacteria bacterium]
MRELYLQINPSGWKMMLMRDRNNAFASLRLKVLDRDNHTCQFCNFTGVPKQMYVINLDGNYNNNIPENMCCACSICTRCVLIGSFEEVDNQESVERLIICNELSQVQLNHLYRILLTSMANKNLPQSEVAKTAFRSFRNRANLVDEMFGPNSSDTRVFSQAIFDAGLSDHKNLRPILQNLRYFPARHSFHREWEIWKAQLKRTVDSSINIIF